MTLPKFFDAETYIWNRFSAADAILVDIRHDDDDDDGGWRRKVLRGALDRAPYKPRIYMEPTSRRKDHDAWMKDIAVCSHKNLHGFLLRIRDGDVLREVESILRRDGQLVRDPYRTLAKIVPPHYKGASVLVDIEYRMIPYAVLKYHNFGGRREGGWDHLAHMVRYTTRANVKALAWRARASPSLVDLEREMNMLKEIGFTGVMLNNSDLIELANKIFN